MDANARDTLWCNTVSVMKILIFLFRFKQGRWAGQLVDAVTEPTCLGYTNLISRT